MKISRIAEKETTRINVEGLLLYQRILRKHIYLMDN